MSSRVLVRFVSRAFSSSAINSVRHSIPGHRYGCLGTYSWSKIGKNSKLMPSPSLRQFEHVNMLDTYRRQIAKEKAAEIIYIKKIEKEKLEKLASKGPNPEEKPQTAAGHSGPGTDEFRNVAVISKIEKEKLEKRAREVKEKVEKQLARRGLHSQENRPTAAGYCEYLTNAKATRQPPNFGDLLDVIVKFVVGCFIFWTYLSLLIRIYLIRNDLSDVYRSNL